MLPLTDTKAGESLLFGITGAVFLLGALVIEYAGIETDKTSLRYNLLLTPLEEGLELIGVWLLLRAQLLHVQVHETVLYKRLQGFFYRP